jgi:hypothetical protein
MEKSRQFEDEKGRIWTVTKAGSTLTVTGNKTDNETLCEIARSCANKLGISQSDSGVPLAYINEHRRIWNCIWQKGNTLPAHDKAGRTGVAG